MITITIDHKPCTCEKGEYLLEAARRNGFYIPTLCHHPGLGEQGCCRVCLVEIISRGKGKIVVSCMYPIEEPIEVLTNSERVKENRAVVLMLLKQRAPLSPEMEALAKAYGAMDGGRFAPLDNEKCIMCGLCARACASLGTGAISTVGRGTQKKVSTPYDEPSSACIGCLSCANICPSGAIPFKEDGKIRSIWGRDFTLAHCSRCGAVIGTKEELELAARKSGHESETLCPQCRKKTMSDVLAHTYGLE